MKKIKTSIIISIFAFSVLAFQACSFSTANMSSLTTAKDKDGKQSASSFTSGDTLYAKANIANNPGKVKVKFTLVADDVKGLNKGETLKGSDVSVDVDGDGFGLYNVPVSAGFLPGTYTLNADMLNEQGEKKDGKNTKVTITGGAPPAASGETTAPADSESNESNR